MNNNRRNRKFMLTINNPSDHGISHESIAKALEKFKTKYYAMCDETGGENNTYHTHIYVFFENAIYFKTLKELFPQAHIEETRGNSAQNRAYLLKSLPEHRKQADGTYEYTDSSGKTHHGQNHTDTFYEVGECPKEQQGHRSDLERMYNLVKEGYTNSEIIDRCGDVAIKHSDKLSRLRFDFFSDKYKTERRVNLKINYIFGKTGTGKTRGILDEYGDANVYRVTDYQHPFDGYQMQPVLCLDEYRSSLRLQDMLIYLDIYPFALPARYSPKVACYETVYVVSNWDFETQYHDLQNDPAQRTSYDAWVRRFNGYVKEYYDVGKYNFYPTMQDYLNRHNGFQPLSSDELSPFDENNTSEPMPFD